MRAYISKTGKPLLIVLLLVAIVFAAPVIMTVALSLPFGGQRVSLGQYAELLITNYTFLRFFWNAALYAVCITLGCVALSFPLGFLFAKVKFPGRDAIFFVYIIVMMLPFQATLLPNFIQLKDWGLMNTVWALILPAAFSPFAVFLFRQVMKSIPNELIEYTLLETSSTMKLLRHIIFPQTRPAVVALSIMVFCESWNMVEQAMLFAYDAPQLHPLSVVLPLLPGDVTYAAATVYMFPILILFFLCKEALSSAMEHFHW